MIPFGKIIIPDLQVGQGDGKIIKFEFIIQVLFAEIDQGIKKFFCFNFPI